MSSAVFCEVSTSSICNLFIFLNLGQYWSNRQKHRGLWLIKKLMPKKGQSLMGIDA